MVPGSPIELRPAAAVLPSAADVAAILRERGWLGDSNHSSEFDLWLADAAAWLGPHAADRAAHADLLGLIFQYDAASILRRPENHVVLAREGAREVVRELALRVLEGPEMDSDRFKQVVAALKEVLPYRGRELFHPIRLALAGRAGAGELDRVILLLDRAARLPFLVPVKGARERLLAFCAALD